MPAKTERQRGPRRTPFMGNTRISHREKPCGSPRCFFDTRFADDTIELVEQRYVSLACMNQAHPRCIMGDCGCLCHDSIELVEGA